MAVAIGAAQTDPGRHTVTSMAQPPPPQAAYLGSEPPPPNRSQQLVSRSGFVVYEGGRTIFDESVLVFLSKPGHNRVEFDVTDHVGRRLGATRLVRPANVLALNPGPVNIFDPGGSQLLRVTNRSAIFSATYGVSGTANGEYRSTNLGSWNLSIEANNEPFGSLVGKVFDPQRAHISILDHDRQPVGKMRNFGDGGVFGSRRDYVLSVDPAVRGEFRRLLIAAPVVSVLLGMASSG